MAMNESLDLAGPAGRLEAILQNPVDEPMAAAVVCHAHPAHGGMMHFKVVYRAARALRSAGVAALRFNFRGVGRSEGSFDGGRGEKDDARAALDEMERRFPGRPLVLGGFSFGSAVALAVGSQDPRVRALFALGYPATLLEDEAPLDGGGKPRLFVQGENDRFGAGDALRTLLEPLPESGRLVVIPGTNHFFDGRLDELQGAVHNWAEERPWEPDQSGGGA